MRAIRKNNCVLFVCCLLLWTAGIAQAQKSPQSNKTRSSTQQQDSLLQQDSSARPLPLALAARALGDSIILRWAPGSVGRWLALSKKGVVIERMEIDTLSKKLGAVQRLSALPIKAWDSATWKPYVLRANAESDQMLLLAAQCLLGEWSVPNTNDIGSFRTAVGNQGNKFTFAMLAADNNPLAAEGLGLRFVDRNVKRGARYIYRIYASAEETTFRDTAVVLCINTPEVSASMPVHLRADEREGKVLLEWDALPGTRFSGYYVYRRDNNGKEQRLNSRPLFTLVNTNAESYTNSFEDSAAGYYVPHTYRIRGVDMFGSESEAAEIVAMGRDRTPPSAPLVKKPFGINAASLLIEWEIADSTNDVAGFIVMKSDSATSRYYPLHQQPLAKNVRRFVDTAANEDEPYYSVVAIDTAQNSSPLTMVYAEIRDTIPPQTPQGIKAHIDSNGVVRISWNLGAEKDLLGYRVLWANQRDHEFTQKSNLVLLDTVFYDTVLVNTLTPYLYYKIVAVDTRYLHSDPSDVIELKRPDIVAPETPFIRNVLSEEKAVHLDIVPSASKDVREHRLQRRIVGEATWKNYALLTRDVRFYRDTTAEQNVSYEYQLVAVDSSNLLSLPSPSVVGRPYDTGIRPAVENLRCVYDSLSNTVRIQWQYPYTPRGKYWFIVYRAYDENGLNQLSAVRPEDGAYTDNKLFGYGRYRYAVRMISERGESPMSEEITVLVTR